MEEEVIKTLMQWATEFKDGVASEFPMLAREIVAYELWSSVAWCVVACLMWSLGVSALKKMNKGDDGKKMSSDAEGIIGVISICLVLFAFFMLIDNVLDIVRATTAPRLVVVEQVMKLVRTGQR